MSRTETGGTESSSGGLTLQDVRDEQPRPVRAGDAAFRGRDPRRLYFVVGEFPNSDLEVVSAKQIEEKTIRVDAYADILDAIDHGRLVTYRASADELTALPSAIDTPDLDEVKR
jgi:hypothetical protein